MANCQIELKSPNWDERSIIMFIFAPRYFYIPWPWVFTDFPKLLKIPRLSLTVKTMTNKQLNTYWLSSSRTPKFYYYQANLIMKGQKSSFCVSINDGLIVSSSWSST